jgi:hypothetical protein
MAGYKDHSRNGGFNRQNVSNDYQTFTLTHDRDVEIFIDQMDVDETNQVAAAANITNQFEEQQAIPETDKYRISKLYADWASAGNIADATVLSESNILQTFDRLMQAMDDAEVPQENRVLYVTPAVNTMLKNAAGMSRDINVQSNNGAINRGVRNLDNVNIIVVPAARMKTAYDFTDGVSDAATASQINLILVHPRSVIACNKHSYIRLWPEGTHTQGDGYLYQNRQYSDLFVIPNRANGIVINVTA